jgi:hypothetical protein
LILIVIVLLSSPFVTIYLKVVSSVLLLSVFIVIFLSFQDVILISLALGYTTSAILNGPSKLSLSVCLTVKSKVLVVSS